jgi:hypothetical protein
MPFRKSPQTLFKQQITARVVLFFRGNGREIRERQPLWWQKNAEKVSKRRKRAKSEHTDDEAHSGVEDLSEPATVDSNHSMERDRNQTEEICQALQHRSQDETEACVERAQNDVGRQCAQRVQQDAVQKEQQEENKDPEMEAAAERATREHHSHAEIELQSDQDNGDAAEEINRKLEQPHQQNEYRNSTFQLTQIESENNLTASHSTDAAQQNSHLQNKDSAQDCLVPRITCSPTSSATSIMTQGSEIQEGQQRKRALQSYDPGLSDLKRPRSP